MDEDDYNPSDKSHSANATEEDEELVIPDAASSSDSDDSAPAMPTFIKTVWETKKSEKIVDKEGPKVGSAFLYGLAYRMKPRQGLAPCHRWEGCC